MPTCQCGKWYHSNFDQYDNGFCDECNGDYFPSMENSVDEYEANKLIKKINTKNKKKDISKD